jgi:hypothetical protein
MPPTNNEGDAQKSETPVKAMKSKMIKKKAAGFRARTHLPCALPFWAHDDGDAREGQAAPRKGDRIAAEMLYKVSRR